MKSTLPLQVVLLTIVLNESFGQVQEKDFFPLGVGNRWTYSYYSWDYATVGDITTIDSGTANYDIIDRIDHADSVLWQFRQIRDIMHSSACCYFFAEPDTTYPVVDTTFFFLTEFSDGAHRIVNHALGYEGSTTVFTFPPDAADSLVVSRFPLASSTDSITLSGITRSFEITMQLKASIGLVHMTTHQGPDVVGVLFGTEHELISAVTSVRHLSSEGIPPKLTVSQNYPNPFNSLTSISYSLPNAGPTRVRIFDQLGRTVAILANDIQSAGEHHATWNATNASSGVYFCTIEFDSKYSRTVKITLIR